MVYIKNIISICSIWLLYLSNRLATPISNYQVLLENITIAKFEFFISLKFTIHFALAYIPVPTIV